MSNTGIVDAKDLIQANATMIAGILIFYTIPYITAGGPYWNREHWSENIAGAIGLFILSIILAFMVGSIPFYTSYLLTIGGVIAIAFAAVIFIKVIKIAKQDRIDSERHYIDPEGGPPMADDETEEASQDLVIDPYQVSTAEDRVKEEEERQKRKGSAAV